MFGARLVCVALLVGSPALVACTDQASNATHSTDPSATDNGRARSDTPSTSVDDKSKNVSLLLTEDEVRSIDGFAGAVVQELQDVRLSENPDPRGPCGAVVPQPPTKGAVGRAFSGSALTVAQRIVETNVGQHAYLESLQTDQHIGCGPYQSTTSTGQTQTVSEINFVDQATNDHAGIGWTARVDVPGGTGYFASSVVEVNGRTAFISIFALTPIDVATLEALVERAVDRLSA